MFLPLVFRGDRLRALVIGGGKVALRKVEALLEAGAEVVVISPEVAGELEDYTAESRIILQRRVFAAEDIRGFSLIIAASDDPVANRVASEEARSAGIPVNVVDQPDLCTVYFTAHVRSDPLLVAVSTGGEAPFLAREFRKRLGEWIAKEGWDRRAYWAAQLRKFARKHSDDPAKRERCFEWFMSLPSSVLAGWDPVNPPEEEWADRLERN